MRSCCWPNSVFPISETSKYSSSKHTHTGLGQKFAQIAVSFHILDWFCHPCCCCLLFLTKRSRYEATVTSHWPSAVPNIHKAVISGRHRAVKSPTDVFVVTTILFAPKYSIWTQYEAVDIICYRQLSSVDMKPTEKAFLAQCSYLFLLIIKLLGFTAVAARILCSIRGYWERKTQYQSHLAMGRVPVAQSSSQFVLILRPSCFLSRPSSLE